MLSYHQIVSMVCETFKTMDKMTTRARRVMPFRHLSMVYWPHLRSKIFMSLWTAPGPDLHFVSNAPELPLRLPAQNSILDEPILME